MHLSTFLLFLHLSLLPLVHGLQISLERVQPFPERFVLLNILLHIVREVLLEKREDNVLLAVVVGMMFEIQARA